MLDSDNRSILNNLYVKDPDSAFGKMPFSHQPDNENIEKSFETAFETLLKQDKNDDGTSFLEIASFRIDAAKEKASLEEELTQLIATSGSRYTADFRTMEMRPEDARFNEITERLAEIDGQLDALDTFMSKDYSSEASLLDVLHFVRKNDKDSDGKLSETEVFTALASMGNPLSYPKLIPDYGTPAIEDQPFVTPYTGGYDGVAEYAPLPEGETLPVGTGYLPSWEAVKNHQLPEIATGGYNGTTESEKFSKEDAIPANANAFDGEELLNTISTGGYDGVAEYAPLPEGETFPVGSSYLASWERVN